MKLKYGTSAHATRLKYIAIRIRSDPHTPHTTHDLTCCLAEQLLYESRYETDDDDDGDDDDNEDEKEEEEDEEGDDIHN